MVAVEVEGFGRPAVPWTVQDFKKETTVRTVSWARAGLAGNTVILTRFSR
jgi:hypothetical protein